jgi:site-specific recombinase XerD
MNISELAARSHHMKAGIVAQHLEGFAIELASLGYTSLTINDFLISAIHFGAWLEISCRSLDDVVEQTVSVFGAHRCKCPGGRSLKRISPRFTARVQRFVDYLQQQGAISPCTNPTTEAPASLSAFRNWLSCHRGLAIKTVDRHERLVTQMLPALGANASTYNAASVRKVILDRIRGCRPAYAKTMLVSLRVYLRFLATSGACQAGLDHALPSVAEWRLSSLPRYLDAAQATRLIDSCEKNGPQGLRDRAIVLLLIRLGLRAGDIAGMRPGDINWQDATLLVRGKGRRDVRLPLPQDAGDAVLDYLECARAHVAIDRVFLCVNAPFRPLGCGGSNVSSIVRAALQRAGITNPPTYGANLLRHTAATMMLRAGSTLYEIGTVLRHKSPDTTAHYAKVDVATLQQIAQPWPNEEGTC